MLQSPDCCTQGFFNICTCILSASASVVLLYARNSEYSLILQSAMTKSSPCLPPFIRVQVFDTPGSHVTRDYREGLGQLGDLRFRVIDTSGLEPFSPSHTLQVSDWGWHGEDRLHRGRGKGRQVGGLEGGWSGLAAVVA